MSAEPPVFKTSTEAIAVNSLCAFCGKIKFRMVLTITNDARSRWSLVRCDDTGCMNHCKFDHSGQTFELDQASEDLAGITTVYGTR